MGSFLPILLHLWKKYDIFWLSLNLKQVVLFCELFGLRKINMQNAKVCFSRLSLTAEEIARGEIFISNVYHSTKCKMHSSIA